MKLLLFIIIVILVIIILIYFMKKNKKNKFINISELFTNNGSLEDHLEDIDHDIVISGTKIDEPDLILIKKEPEDLSISELVSGTREKKKIPFIVNTIEDSYIIELPSYEDFGFNSKGIVIAGSGNSYRYVTGIFINIYILRKIHNCNLPIEIFYVSQEEEFPYEIRNAILELGNVSFVDVLDRLDIGLENETYSNSFRRDKIDDLRGYQTKTLAVLCSSFEEVILMDADALFFMNPQYLFDIKGYSSHGMVLFKDYVECLHFVSEDFINKIGIGSRKFCDITGSFEIDSSCIVINKQRAWEALYTICFINVKSDQYYRHKNQPKRYYEDGTLVRDNVLGDKDTWLIGSLFANFTPFVDKYVDPLRLVIETNNGPIEIDGHFQRATVTIEGTTSTIPIYYNNQKLKLENLTMENLQNISYNGNKLPDNVINSFLACKDAYGIIMNSLPYELTVQKPVFTDFYYEDYIP